MTNIENLSQVCRDSVTYPDGTKKEKYVRILIQRQRYGITVYRRKFNASGRPEELTDSLLPGDRRRALQLPQEVITAGYKPNPR